MLRCAPVSTLIVAVLLHFACPAPAQSPDEHSQLPGYWYRGEWNGFLRARNTVQVQAVPQIDSDAAIVPIAYEETLPTDIDELPVASTVHGAGDCNSGACCGTPRLWGRAEYLGWWIDGMKVPPLVTTSPAASAGVLGQPGTSILFGDGGLNTDARSGGRFTLGMWLDECEFRGVEATYLGLGGEPETFAASTAEIAVLARPFFNVGANQQDARLIALAGTVSGSVSVTADTEFQGAEILFRRGAARTLCSRTDYLLGYRWTQLRDSLLIDESTLSLASSTDTVTVAESVRQLEWDPTEAATTPIAHHTVWDEKFSSLAAISRDPRCEVDSIALRRRYPEMPIEEAVKAPYEVWGERFTSLKEVSQDARCTAGYSTLWARVNREVPLEIAVV